MRPATRFLIIFLALITFLISGSVSANESNKIINDSLVEDLDCQKLSTENIYRAIREDAFDVSRNIPIKNWSFRSGTATIAGCWALSRTQRMVSYLARYNQTTTSHLQERVHNLLDMVRGASLKPWIKGAENYFTESPEKNFQSEAFFNEKTSENSIPIENIEFKTKTSLNPWEKPLVAYKVFPVEESNFYESHQSPEINLWHSMQLGFEQYLGLKKIRRNFRTEIQALQARLFFRTNNFKMIWETGDRSKKQNHTTAQRLLQNLDGKRLTLINLRIDRMRQHVVMAKTYQHTAPEIIEFKVYDSNSPQMDKAVYYNSQRQTFFAPAILEGFKDPNPYRKLGVFIVDEGDRKYFEKAMLNYYQDICQDQ